MRRARGRAPDPWTQVLEQHITTERAPLEARTSGRKGLTLRRQWLVVAGVVLVALLAGVGALGALTVINNDRASENLERAEEWQNRSDELSDLVSDRTRALNRQTARLNVASNRLRSARRSVARSEQDVANLEERQRELAAEKAAVEDDRAALALDQQALAEVATKLDECNTELVALLLAVDGGYATNAQVDTTAAICNDAKAAVESYTPTAGVP